MFSEWKILNGSKKKKRILSFIISLGYSKHDKNPFIKLILAVVGLEKNQELNLANQIRFMLLHVYDDPDAELYNV